tara:strand:+ start:180 stop:581 length:402 start_codon:yes stop_codon:yes gene_type:complete
MAVHATLVHPQSIKTKLDSLVVKPAQITLHPYKPVTQAQTVSACQATQDQTVARVRRVSLANSRPHQAAVGALTVLTTPNPTLVPLCASAMLGSLEMAAVARSVSQGNTKRQLGQQHALLAAMKELPWQQALL